MQGAYEEAAQLLHKLFALRLSVSAAATLSQESGQQDEAYYAYQPTLPTTEKVEDERVGSVDGTGVPMSKKEAAKIKARLGTGEKRQKKQAACVGVPSTIHASRRTAEEVAGHGVFPEQQTPVSEPTAKAPQSRYLASIQRPKRAVMRDIKRAVQAEPGDDTPLLGVMDGAQSFWNAFQEVFQDIKHKVMILDIMHVLEYLWLMASVNYPAVDDQAKSDVDEQ